MSNNSMSEEQWAVIGRWAKKWSLRTISAILALMVISGSWFIVPAGHIGVLTRAGAPLEAT